MPAEQILRPGHPPARTRRFDLNSLIIIVALLVLVGVVVWAWT